MIIIIKSCREINDLNYAAALYDNIRDEPEQNHYYGRTKLKKLLV